MLTPAVKLWNHRNDIVQIVITRKCDIHTCSNCTQLLPFRKDPKEMSLDCFRKALLAMEGWPGVISVFGGNPVMHSQFPEICEILTELVPNQAQRGLWTNNLLGYGELIKKTFWPNGRFNLNVHGNLAAEREMRQWLPGIKTFGQTTSHHGQVLGNYRDYGLTEEAWVDKREHCDINQNWSAGVYERAGEPYVYFCEVAGSIDGMTGENNGLKAEKGWWVWHITRFQDQIDRCCDKHCLVPLRLKGHDDDQAVYDISPSLQEVCVDQRKGKVAIQSHESLGRTTHELTDYIGLRTPGK